MNTMLQFAGIVRNLQSWNTGMRRVNKILEEERQNGFQAEATGIYSNGADIFVHKGDRLVRVYEVTNYAKDGYIQLSRGERYRDNLRKYHPDVDNVFVCSYDENLIPLGGRSFFTQHGIRVVVKGCQD